jgi:hypothetical protein
MLEEIKKPEEFIVIRKMSSFNELLQNLAALPEKQCIFRGVSNSDYELIPSVLRGEKATEKLMKKIIAMQFIYTKTNYSPNYVHGGYSHIECEMISLYHFYRSCNYQGLVIPRISLFDHVVDAFQGTFNVMQHIQRVSKFWYGNEFEDIAALAQHYGLPTRMIDFSYEKDTALYMAIVPAVRKLLANPDLISSMLSIYAFPFSGFQFAFPKLRFVTPNYNANANICAQKGLMVYWLSDINDHLQDMRKPLNVSIADVIKSYKENDGSYATSFDDKPIIRFDISYIELLSGFSYLIKTGNIGDKFFHGYTGAIMSIYEYELYRSLIELYKSYVK